MIPRVELHLHLDCCLSFRVARRLVPSLSRERYRRELVLPAGCPGLEHFLARMAPCLELLQTEDALRLLTHDVFRQLQEDGVIYAELRFAPLLHTEAGLSPERVVEVVAWAAAEASRATGVGYGIILCCLRHFSAAESLRTAHLAERFRRDGVVGLDLAGDEAGFPLDAHIEAFRFVGERGLCLTAHAGEARGPASVVETLERLRPSRIGHGVRSIESPELIERLIEHGIHLEVCPTSNVLIGIFGSLRDHPVDRLFRTGVSMGINTDGRGVLPITLEAEARRLTETFDWRNEHFRRCALHAAGASFAGPEVKADLARRIGE